MAWAGQSRPVMSAGSMIRFGWTKVARWPGRPGALAGDAVSRDWDEPLDELRWHWGDAYLIHYFETAGKWVAQRRDSHTTMSADSPVILREKINQDYAARPVGRQFDGRQPGSGILSAAVGHVGLASQTMRAAGTASEPAPASRTPG
jgi:hypothetical protein